MTAAPSAADRLAEALAEHRLTTPRQCTCGWREEGDGWERRETWPEHVAAALLPVVDAIAAERAAEAVRPFEELFAGGPDTSCRTTWHGGGAGAIECVEVPMADLRDAFARAAALRAAAPTTHTEEQA